LLGAESRFDELAELLSDEVSGESDPKREQRLYSELGHLHQLRTGDMLAALDSFVAAEDWNKAIEVAGANHADRALGRKVCERLLDLSVKAWQRAESGADSPEAQAAGWAVTELSERLLEAGEYEAVVARLLTSAELPFETQRRRELRRDAACLCSIAGRWQARDRTVSSAAPRDAGDEVARSLVTRLALLLEEAGEHAEIVTLWERQATARAAAGDSSGAAALWARAGHLPKNASPPSIARSPATRRAQPCAARTRSKPCRASICHRSATTKRLKCSRPCASSRRRRCSRIARSS